MGCAHIKFEEKRGIIKQEKTVTHHSFFLGLINSNNTVNLSKLCEPSQLLEAETSTNIIYLGISILTLGIYIPTQSTIHCDPL